MIFVNFKTYEQGTGAAAVALAKILEEVANARQLKIIPAVQVADIKEVAAATKLEVWAQRVDPVSFGAHTGAILPEAVFEDGAGGVFLNHSENKFAVFADLKSANERAVGVGLKTLIFAAGLEELKSICELKPTYAAYEPPELVGSKEVSVASVQPEIIAKASVTAREAGVPLVVGAGIHSADDVRKSVEFGAAGVAVATDVVTAEDPKKELLDLASGFE